MLPESFSCAGFCEYADAGSGRSIGFSDWLVRLRGTSDRHALAKLILAAIEMKGAWQLPLAREQNLVEAMEDPELAKLLVPKVQQVRIFGWQTKNGHSRLTTASLAACVLRRVAQTPQGTQFAALLSRTEPLSYMQPSKWWTRAHEPFLQAVMQMMETCLAAVRVLCAMVIPHL
jgi:hypothetical protein